MATGSVNPRSKTDHYFELVKKFPLKPIRNERDLDKAIAMADSLVIRKRTRDEDDYLDVLTDLVEKYESATIAEPPMSDGLMLTALLEARGLTQSRVARDTGIAESTISEVIGESRELTRSQVARLVAYFKIPADSFSYEA